MVSDCKSNLKSYVLKGYTNNAKKLTVIALAKDGHLIYGPYQDDGNLINCAELDMCNGK